MVQRNLQAPFRFVCLTDDPSAVACATVALPPGLNGWWNKLAVFQHAAKVTIGDRILMLDLDVVITGSLDPLLETEADLVLTLDWWRPEFYNGACFLLRAGAFPEVWDQFSPATPAAYYGDQEWMTACIPRERVRFWPSDWIASYKTHGQLGVPSGSRVVCFHGEPKPHQLPEGSWPRQLWN